MRPVYGAIIFVLAAILFGVEFYDFFRMAYPFDTFSAGRRFATMAADVVVVAAGPVAYVRPARSSAVGWLAVLATVASLIAGTGGYYLGALLAVIGAGATIRWSPTY